MVDTAHGPLFQGGYADGGWVALGAPTPPDAPPECCPDHEAVEAIQCCNDCPDADDDDPVIVIDMAYLNQRAMERALAAGEPLPDGITPAGLAAWRDAHPDYDPALPLAGMPLPDHAAGIEVGGGTSYGPFPALPTDRPDLARPVDRFTFVPPRPTEDDFDRLPVLSVDSLRRAMNGGVIQTVSHPTGGTPEVVDAEVIAPDARCLAATGAPVDRDRQCKVHADGSHHCYEGPGHQGAKALAPVVMAPCNHVVPEWATHRCDCGFRWANVVQVPA